MNGKTIKQIADEIGIDKQKVYRYIKRNRISEAHQINGVMYYDEAVESAIKQALFENSTMSEAHQGSTSDVHWKHINEAVSDTVLLMLQKELEIKNRQIDELNARLAETTAALVTAQQTAQAAQALHAGTIQQQLEIGSADTKESTEKQGFIKRLFGRK